MHNYNAVLSNDFQFGTRKNNLRNNSNILSKLNASIKYFKVFTPEKTTRKPPKLYVFIKNYRKEISKSNIGSLCIAERAIKLKLSPNQIRFPPCGPSIEIT